MSLSLQLGLVYLISEVLLTLLRQAFGGQAFNQEGCGSSENTLINRHPLRKHLA